MKLVTWYDVDVTNSLDYCQWGGYNNLHKHKLNNFAAIGPSHLKYLAYGGLMVPYVLHRSCSALVKVDVVTGNHAISLNSIDLPSVKSCGIHYRAIPQKCFDYWKTFDIFIFKFQLHRPGANRLNYILLGELSKYPRRGCQFVISGPRYVWNSSACQAKICVASTRFLMKMFYSAKEAYWYTETEKSSFWWNVHHWLHWKLSKWQLPVQPVMKISSKWRHFCFSVVLPIHSIVCIF